VDDRLLPTDRTAKLSINKSLLRHKKTVRKIKIQQSETYKQNTRLRKAYRVLVTEPEQLSWKQDVA